MAFEEFQRPPIFRNAKVSVPKFRVEACGKRLYLTHAAAGLLGLDPYQRYAPVALLFDAERNLLGVRSDPDGAYRFTRRYIACRDFLAHHRIKKGTYAAESLSSVVVAAEVEVEK